MQPYVFSRPQPCASRLCSPSQRPGVICLQVVDVSEGTPQVMKYPRKGSFEISYMLREEGHTFAKEIPIGLGYRQGYLTLYPNSSIILTLVS